MSSQIIAALALCLSWGCAVASIESRFRCSADELGDWEIPAAWMAHELTPTEARVEVSTANLSKDSMEARWKEMHARWRTGDAFWLYRRMDEQSIHALGVQRGVVLIRGCEQLGFITTKIMTEEPR